ncbi:MAG: hypothetical protein OFPI_13530 [Osedax symbiont Rs2]|nr:MAG: hypothetical protein OFPI_13530 [Osedax symbiont Rs2]
MFLKAFIRIFLLVTIPVVVLTMPVTSDEAPLDNIATWLIKDKIEDTFQGTFALLEHRLQQHPERQWPAEFAKISQHFSYPITLRRLTDYAAHPKQQQLLKADQYIVSDEDDVSIITKRIAGTSWVIEMYNDEPLQEDIRKTTAGAVTLIADYLAARPREQWATALGEIQQMFAFPIRQVELHSLQLQLWERLQLQQTGTVTVLDDDGLIWIYQQLPHGQPLLKLGPIPISVSSSSLFYMLVAILLATISIGILIFVYLLWRDINKLTKVAARFGDGHLSQRSLIRASSVLSPLANSFDQMAERIQSTITSQRDLTNAIAHDLRTPLSRLSFALEMLDSPQLLELDRQRYTQAMVGAIDTLDHLIQQMLVLARYTRATDISHFGDSQLAQVLHRELELLRRDHPQLSFNLYIDPVLDNREIFIDIRAIQRALNNLVANAVRYAQRQVKISLKIQRQTYYLSICDDGPGIPLADRQQVFDAFAQLNNKQRELDTGHGLGLAIVKQIAQWHAGDVSISDCSLGGAKVTLCWPAKTPVTNNKV